eukprot:9484722-Pyramimonas_sp.AAC.1
MSLSAAGVSGSDDPRRLKKSMGIDNLSFSSLCSSAISAACPDEKEEGLLQTLHSTVHPPPPPPPH